MQWAGGVVSQHAMDKAMYAQGVCLPRDGICLGMFAQEGCTPPNPEADPSPEMTMETGGTHPAGMHSCFCCRRKPSPCSVPGTK